MVIDCNVKERHPGEAGIPQGSPVSSILFKFYTSELITWVKERVAGAEGLFFVEDVGCVATGNHVNQNVRKLKACAGVSIDWAE